MFNDNAVKPSDNLNWHFPIYKQRSFHAQLCIAKRNLPLLVILDLLAGQVPCSAELSIKKVL